MKLTFLFSGRTACDECTWGLLPGCLHNEDAHHYLIFVGRRHAAVVIVVPLSIVFVLGVRGIWAEDKKEALDRFLSVQHSMFAVYETFL